MESKRLAKSWSKHNAPVDVWVEILSRLPVRSLLRFRCVSKSWQSLIDDSDFCHLHLNRFKNNTDETHLLAVQGGVEYCFIRCSDTFKTTRRLGCLGSWDRNNKTYRSTATPGYDGCWHIWFSVDGLVLLKCIAFVQKTRLMLWNPSIRKCRLLPHSPDISSDITKCVELGLGFDPLIKDYKLVRVAFHTSSVCSVEIYTVGTSSWKTIQFQGKGCSTSNWPWSAYERESVYFKGCLYFVSGRRELVPDNKELVSFDLSSEVFTFSNLPVNEDHSSHIYFHDSLIFVDGGCSLAVLRSSTLGGTIWALENSNINDSSLSWSKRSTFTRSIPRFLYLKKNGDLLLGLDKGHQVISYNTETQAEKLIPKTNCPKVTNKVCSYKESLVLLK